MCEVVRLEIVPDDLDVIEFGGVFGQPLNGEPVCPGSERCARELTDMDRSIALYQHDRLDPPARHGAVELIELLEMRRQVTATLVRLVWTISWRVM